MRLLKIGRSAKCDIVLNSQRVSSVHAELTLMDNGDMMLEDKNSLNGTYIGNQQMKPGSTVKINRFDAVQFADTQLDWSKVPTPEDNSAYKALFGIGSHFNNDFQISGATVSRYHATVKQGKNGKMYIFDHSQNGTTVDGQKIMPNTPYVLKRKSVVICGGVRVDLSRLPWANDSWKAILGVAACAILLVGIGIGIYKLLSHKTWTAAMINDRYSSSVVMLVGSYHLEVNDFGVDVSDKLYTKFVFDKNGEIVPVTPGMSGSTVYTGTGFFISEDAKIITNLHVVKPWLEPTKAEEIAQFEQLFRRYFAGIAEQYPSLGLTAYTSQIKIIGVSDGIMLVPQGSFFSPENATYCTVLSAGDDINKDVALIQSDKMTLPNKNCSYVNIKDSMDVSEDAIEVGKTMFTVGFPYGMSLQDLEGEKGIQVFCHEGKVTQQSGEFDFNYDAVTAGGASGSPVFNDKGMLIGVHHSGVTKENINQGVKAKYIKELIDSPHKK